MFVPSPYDRNNPDDPYVSTDKVLVSIGEKYGKTPQQVGCFSTPMDSVRYEYVSLDQTLKSDEVQHFCEKCIN